MPSGARGDMRRFLASWRYSRGRIEATIAKPKSRFNSGFGIYNPSMRVAPGV
jgi:hypothetical protein